MKDFGQWFQEQAPAAPPVAPEPDLPDGIQEVVKTFSDGSGHYIARCRVCDRDYDLDLDRLSDFDSNMSYCGGNPWCTP